MLDRESLYIKNNVYEATFLAADNGAPRGREMCWVGGCERGPLSHWCPGAPPSSIQSLPQPNNTIVTQVGDATKRQDHGQRRTEGAALASRHQSSHTVGLH